jgi:hypothetical protein
MSCCGKMREQAWPGSTSAGAGLVDARRFAVRFVYEGRSALSVVGPVSGQRYRFEAPGAQLTVDPRDRPGLARLPMLRQVVAS